jgi:hypothetical protein
LIHCVSARCGTIKMVLMCAINSNARKPSLMPDFVCLVFSEHKFSSLIVQGFQAVSS